MQEESSNRDAQTPLGPLAAKWVEDLKRWYQQLQRHFKFNPASLAENVRRSSKRWRRRLRYLKKQNPELFAYVIGLVEQGHVIPFETEPKKFFRHRNPPSLAKDKQRAWEAIKGDIEHGAIEPVDIATDGIPNCVCPVRTADKTNGKARFVHNTRHPNNSIPKEEAQCELESLLKTRNMYTKGGFVIGSDFASGYHCIFMHEDDRKYLAFALHTSEVPEDALEWLHKNYPHTGLLREKTILHIPLPGTAIRPRDQLQSIQHAHHLLDGFLAKMQLWRASNQGVKLHRRPPLCAPRLRLGNDDVNSHGVRVRSARLSPQD